MVGSCCALGCGQRFERSPHTFHCFPKDPDLQRQWVEALRRKDFVPRRNTLICSKHFEEKCFDGRSLRSDAVPTIFNFNTAEQVFGEEGIGYSKETDGSLKYRRFRYIGDFKEIDMEDAVIARKFLHAARIDMEGHLSKKTKLSKKNASLRKEVAVLNRILNNLKEIKKETVVKS